MRLSYNSFIGDAPQELGLLKDLKLIHLHGNRIAGSISLSLSSDSLNKSSFIADCGAPSIYEDPVDCPSCTMCCNSLDDCYPQDENKTAQEEGLKYTDVLWILFLGILCTCWLVHITLFYKRQKVSLSLQQLEMKMSKDKEYALDTIGRDSVYRFFLGKSWQGWSIALVILLSQVWVLFIFVEASELNLADDNKDLEFTWKCPRDENECRDTIGMGAMNLSI